MNLYLFFSEKTATPIPQLAITASRVRELLEELVSRSDGKLTLKVIDPQPFSEEEDRANELGITSVPVGRERRQAATSASPPPIPPTARKRSRILDPQLEEQLEYDVAKLIHKLSSAKKPVVGWLSSLPMQGDFDMQTGRPRPAVGGLRPDRAALHRAQPRAVADRRSTNDVDVLVLVHPKDLPPAALYAIDQFAMRGGHILAFVDPNAQADQSGADPNNPMAQFTADKSSHLEPLLAAWGVEFKPDQVVARSRARPRRSPCAKASRRSQHIAVLGFDASQHGEGRGHRAPRQHQHGHRG